MRHAAIDGDIYNSPILELPLFSVDVIARSLVWPQISKHEEIVAPHFYSDLAYPSMGEYRSQISRYSKMRSILVIQPNSTQSMTDALKPLVDLLHFKDVNQLLSHGFRLYDKN